LKKAAILFRQNKLTIRSQEICNVQKHMVWDQVEKIAIYQ